MTVTSRKWGISWLALTASLGLHVWDEAEHDFLSVYNPTVLAIRERWPFVPLPTFTFGWWLGGLCAAVAILGCCKPVNPGPTSCLGSAPSQSREIRRTLTRKALWRCVPSVRTAKNWKSIPSA